MNQAVDDIKLPPIHINRNYMIFGAAAHKDLFDKSLTNKNSSENFSITQSMQEAVESEKIGRDQIKTTHHMLQLNASRSASLLPYSVEENKMKIVAYQEKGRAQAKAQAKTYNIYKHAHQHLLQRLRDQRLNSNDRVREESLEDIGDGDEEEIYHQREESSHPQIDESGDLRNNTGRNDLKKEEEMRDVVGSQMGDEVSQGSMHRG